MLIRRLSGWPSTGWDNVLEEMESMRRQLSLLTDRSYTGPGEQFAGVFPLINVAEDKDNFYIRAELPGIKTDDLDISVTGETSSISGERKMESEKDKVRYHRKEREGGKFNRIFTLPGQIDPEKVEAKSINGILTVTLPKAEKTKPRQIRIKSS